MTLQQLRYLIQVVEYRSITEAARHIYISQPALSNSIRDLEREMQIEIFSRQKKGISLTEQGAEFLAYARQVVEQVDLLETRFSGKTASKHLCSISTQHYAFAVNAFCNLIKASDTAEYEYTLRETRTAEILTDVRDLKSEIGILYLNKFNKKILSKFIQESSLAFSPLFRALPHVFVSASCDLAKKSSVTFKDLEPYPYLCFEQGDFNSFYFSEELQSTESHKKTVRVSDRGTLFNLIIGINGYTISSGIITSDLNGTQIVAIPLKVNDDMTVGYVTRKDISISAQALRYIEELKKCIRECGCTLLN